MRAGMVLFLCMTGMGFAGSIPAPPAPKDVFPQWLALTDNAAVQNLFDTTRGTPPAEYMASGCVRLPVHFAGTRTERASWDIAIKTDLRRSRGIAFDFYCRDLEPFSSFSLYFHTGGGWYHASFSPEKAGAWQHITVDKSDVRSEGEPGGWSAVDTLRLSGWRATDADTVCAIANLGPAGGKAEVLVVRSDSSVARMPGEAAGFGRYASTVSDALDRLNVASAQVSDTELDPELLKSIALVVLPYNPYVPDATVMRLRDFVGRGGKLLVCYSLPRPIGDLLGIVATGGSEAKGGAFAGFARTAQGLPEQPAFAPQGSWRTTVAKVADGHEGRVIAVWRDGDGNDTTLPAMTLTPTGAYIGHVWLGSSDAASTALMRALVGELVPGTWQKSAEKAFADIGRLADAEDFDALRASLLALDGGAPAASRQALDTAARARDEAREAMQAGRWNASLDASRRAAEAALRAWCLSRTSRTGEHRAFWCHSAFGLRGMDWDASIRMLKENGFNAILPNMLWGGLAYYPSKVLPEYRGLAEQGDQLALCLAACKRYGVQCHVWKVNWNTGNRAPKPFMDRLRAEGRLQKEYDGDTNEWLCPSNPTNQNLEVDAMLEIVRTYDVAGVHFDYIRYPGRQACFCDGCRARFEARLGRPVAHWPQDTRSDDAVREKWLDFRRSNIDAVVRRVAQDARRIRPGVKISAAVFRNWPVDRDGVGQDWKLWCDKGWLDFVCPMDYIDANALFRNVVAVQQGYAGKVPLYPGIGLSCWKNPRDAVKLAQQISIVRDLGLSGYTVFNFDANAEAVLPYLRLGVTADR